MKIALFRPEVRAEEAKRTCERNGFVAVIAPAIEIKAMPVDTEGLREHLMRASVCVLMSSTAAEVFLEKLQLPSSLLQREGLSVVSVGEATRRFLEERSVESLTPEIYSSEGVVELISSMHSLSGSVLVLRSNMGSSVLREGLARKGIEVAEIPLYDIVLPEDTSPLKLLVEELLKGERFALPFSSSMMVRNFFSVARDVKGQEKLLTALEKCSVWAIGNETYREIMKHGVRHAEVAASADYDSMLREIFESYH